MKLQSVSLVMMSLSLLLPVAARAEGSAEGERLLTPNQQRRIVQVNNDLPKDILDQQKDSPKVAELRRELRSTYADYQKVARQFGNGTPESRQAARRVMDAQKALHKQFIQEEAIPAVSLLSQ